MYSLTVTKGRRINKILFFICLIPAVVLVAAAGICALTGKEALAHTFFIIGVIWGGFALFYGILWLIFAVRERRQQRAFEEIDAAEAEGRAPEFACTEYILPKEELTQAARRRFGKIVLWSCITAFLVSVCIFLMLFFSKSIGSPLQVLYIAAFGAVIIIPGSTIQAVIYYRYTRSVPGKIVLYPGKIVIDRTVYTDSSVTEIQISSSEIKNTNSPAVYRELRINSKTGSEVYRIDFRMPGKPSEQPRWTDYSRFVSDLYEWGKENRTEVKIDYMD